MKKTITLILALFLCFSLTACTNPFIDYLNGVLSGGTDIDEFVDNVDDFIPDDYIPDDYIPDDNTDTGDSSSDYSDYPAPILYKVIDDDGSYVWLFGSIHIGVDEMYPLPEYVTDAYYEADSLAVEFNILETAESSYETMNAMTQLLYMDGSTIYDHINPELYENAVAILTENGEYDPLFDMYMPVIWSNTINQIIVRNLGYDSEKGIDMNFLNLATSEGKEIVEIESLAFQYGMLAGYSPELQELLLSSAVDDYYNENIDDDYEELIDLWCSGDVDNFARYLSSSDYVFDSEEDRALYDEYNTAMRTERNINMADFAEDALMYDQQIFICVGAAHIVGEGGMADLLSQRGYYVELVR